MSWFNRCFRPALLVLLLLPFSLLMKPMTAAAQIRPGIERGDYWGEVRAQYRNQVLQEVGGLMESWLAAWNNDDPEAIIETFAEDGVLILDGARIVGEEAIQTRFEGALPEIGAIEHSLIDFDVRGEMAFATSRFQYRHSDGEGARSEVTGHLVWILVKHDEGWKVRSQIFQRSGA
jgi:uncharacterized protein (TIGR02246 family)